MPEEEKKTVDIDTSGPGAEIDIEEKKDELLDLLNTLLINQKKIMEHLNINH